MGFLVQSSSCGCLRGEPEPADLEGCKMMNWGNTEGKELFSHFPVGLEPCGSTQPAVLGLAVIKKSGSVAQVCSRLTATSATWVQRLGFAMLARLVSGNPPTSGSQSAGITASTSRLKQSTHLSLLSSQDHRYAAPHVNNCFIFCRDFFCRVAQAVLKFLSSSDPPTSASQSSGIT
ncbi:hypothetical protein AAY473_025033, partial [Plecturocebus cupreus]